MSHHMIIFAFTGVLRINLGIIKTTEKITSHIDHGHLL